MRTLQYSALAVVVVSAGALILGCENMDQKQSGDAAKVQPGQKDKSVETMPPLTDAEAYVIRDKGTERPFTGKYWDYFGEGVYLCRQCGAPLYRSDSKFRSECGWPSFDDAIPGAVIRQTDADGRRTEITCANCGAHLGHVFTGERYTPKDTRYCVNSVSLVFRTIDQFKKDQAAKAEALAKAKADEAKVAAMPKPEGKTETAIFAGGCFWGVEKYFDKAPGVISATSGYTGGSFDNPTYEDVCTDKTGHAEAVQVVYDPTKTSYEKLAKLFFDIHDPTTLDRQGPDVGTQYRSAIFYENDQQKKIAEDLIKQLRDKGYKVVTQVAKASKFYPAEAYHQDYMKKHPGRYDCHIFTPRFDIPLEND